MATGEDYLSDLTTALRIGARVPAFPPESGKRRSIPVRRQEINTDDCLFEESLIVSDRKAPPRNLWAIGGVVGGVPGGVAGGVPGGVLGGVLGASGPPMPALAKGTPAMPKRVHLAARVVEANLIHDGSAEVSA